MTTKRIWVVICPDATPLWRTSVTNSEVFVHSWGEGIQAANDIHRWAMWFCLDGLHDAGCLVSSCLDLEAKFSEQVRHVQSECRYYIEGVWKEFECILTGDGKHMSVTNGGGKCWEGCTDCNGLHPVDKLPTEVQWGAFLRDVKGRVGDVEHGMCGFVNMFKKRLTSNLVEWVQGVPSIRNIMASLVDIWDDLQDDAKRILVAHRLSQRRTKEGQFDLSTSKLFLQKRAYATRLVAALRQHFPMRPAGGGICLGCCGCVAAQFHKPLWFVEGVCATSGCTNPCCSGTHCQYWGVLGEDGVGVLPSGALGGSALRCPAQEVWDIVHIVSSIPSEHHHRPFKVVVKNSFQGWCLQRPRVSRRGLGHVMGMEAFDIGLRRQAARDNLEWREAMRDRRKWHCRFV